jgi:uncharacterized membrane protein
VGERAADRVATAMGSWRFIIIQTVFVALWMACNVVGFVHHWDIFPFILLNLLFSTQAAYAAPIIMMSQNRQAAKDRLRDDHEAGEVSQILAILDLVHTLSVNQMAILQEMVLARQERDRATEV